MSFDHVSLKENIDKERVQRIKDRKIVFIMKKIREFVKAHMKKISKIKSHMLTNTEHLHQIIK
jgi:hypothetical protein